MKKIGFILMLLASVAFFCATASVESATLTDSERGNSYVWFDGFLLGAFIWKPPSGVPGGWVSGDMLQNDEKYQSVKHLGGNECKIYSSNGFEGEGIAEAVKQEHSGEFDKMSGLEMPLMLNITRQVGSRLSLGSALLAIWGSEDLNPIPRKAAVLATNSETYNKVVQGYLTQRGLPNAQARITQLYKIDLDGDGTDEVVIYAQNISKEKWEPDKPLLAAPVTSHKGDYSVAFVRKIVDGKVREIPLYEFVNTSGDTNPNNGQPMPFLHKIFQFVDLNGDGVMEIIIGDCAYESFGFAAFEIRGGEAKAVLQIGGGA